MADKLGITQATLAMAWVLSNKRVSTAITGASKPEQVYESLKALKAVELFDAGLLKEIDEILAINLHPSFGGLVRYKGSG